MGVVIGVTVETLNFLFNKWNMTSTEFWNMSGDPCSGPPITQSQYDDIYYKQAIKCNCTFNDNTTCHITHLYVSTLLFLLVSGSLIHVVVTLFILFYLFYFLIYEFEILPNINGWKLVCWY